MGKKIPQQFQNPTERGKIDTTHNAQINDLSLNWNGTGTSINSGSIKLV